MKTPNIFELTNGLKVVHLPSTDINTLTIQLRGKAGSNYEDKDQIGAAHMNEHLSVHTTHPNKRPTNILAEIGGKFIGVTSRDDVAFGLRILKEDLETGIKCLSKVFIEPDISEANVLVQKDVIRQEIRRYKDIPEKMINRICYKILYQNQRMSILNTGTTDDIQKLSIHNIKNFRQKNYGTNNFILIIAGNSTIEDVKKFSEKYFSDYSNKSKQVPIILKKDNSFRIEGEVLEKLVQAYVRIDYYGYEIKQNLKHEAYILSKVINSLITNQIKNTLGLVYNISCTSFSSANYGIWSIYFSTEIDKVVKTMNEVKKILSGIDNYIRDDFVESAKKNVLNEIEFMLEKTSVRASYYAELILHGNDNATHVQEIEYIRKIKTQDIKKVSKEILLQNPKITYISNTKLDKELANSWLS